MHRLPFSKLSGAGNDFIVLDECDCRDIDPSWLAARLCARAHSLGADGLILARPASHNSVSIQFFNSDGSRAEMCGNGSRCAARFALERGFVTADCFRLQTEAGDLEVAARPGGRFEVATPAPDRVRLRHFHHEIDGQPVTVHSLRVGVPHAVVVVPNVDRIDEATLIAAARGLRYDARFPQGANVNVISLPAQKPLRQRTYERGVEALTKACGTGSTASALVAHEVFGRSWPVELTVDGGSLTIEKRQDRLWLIGDARLIATGLIEPEASAW